MLIKLTTIALTALAFSAVTSTASAHEKGKGSHHHSHNHRHHRHCDRWYDNDYYKTYGSIELETPEVEVLAEPVELEIEGGEWYYDSFGHRHHKHHNHHQHSMKSGSKGRR